MTSVFIEPLDVLVLRANKLFGDPGSYGESLVPPWPSVAAGAIRSAVLAREGDAFAFARGEWSHPALGTPSEPGPFTVTAFHLARRGDRVEPLFEPPADIVIERDDDGVVMRRILAKQTAERACFFEPAAIAAGPRPRKTNQAGNGVVADSRRLGLLPSQRRRSSRVIWSQRRHCGVPTCVSASG